ncbi:MAG: hypothetical protein ACK5JI_02490 [Azonexus sp.]
MKTKLPTLASACQNSREQAGQSIRRYDFVIETGDRVFAGGGGLA